MTPRRKYLIFILIIFLFWLPVYLAYYPGVFSYDILVQTQMLMGVDPFTSQQPIIHTLFFGACIKMGNAIGIHGIVIYSILQMLALAAACAYVLTYMCEKKTGKVYRYLVLLFYSLNPVISIYSFSTCKNILFGACFLIFSLELIQFTKGVGKTGRLFVFSLLGCLLLNNFIYVIVVFSVIALIFMRKSSKKLLMGLIPAIASFAIISALIFPAMGYGKGDTKEMLSVPLQQLVYAKESGNMTPEQESELLSYFEGSSYGYFQFGNADMIKTRFSTAVYNEKKSEFWALYRSMFTKCPKEYIYVFLRLNFPLWSPIGFELPAYTMTKYIETSDFEVPVAGFEGFERKSVFPGLYELFERFTSYSMLKGRPVREFVFGLSIPFWVVVICGLKVLFSRKFKKLLPLLPALLLTGTYLLGPLSNMRYVFPNLLLIPLLIFYSFWEN